MRRPVASPERPADAALRRPAPAVIDERRTTAAAARPLLVIPWSPALPGGVSVVVRQLAAHWPDAVTAINDWNARVPTRDATDATDAWRFRFSWPAAPHGLGLLRSLLVAPAWLARCLAFLRSQQAGSVHVHYPGLELLGLAALRRLRLFNGRLVLCFHGTDVRQPGSAHEARLYRWLLGSADAVCACSSALAGRLERCYGFPASRVVVVHNGVDPQLFRPPGDGEDPHPADRLPAPYIVNVSSYIPRKDQQLLLQAFAGLAGRLPLLDLVFVGMDGPERRPLQARAAALGLADRVHCRIDLPPEQVAAVLRGAAVCVQASIEEPFGLAVIEAGASGVPVIATAVEGHAELLEDGVTGSLFAVGDAAACQRLLVEQLMRPDAGRERAARFRREVLDRYTWQRCAAAYRASPGAAVANR